MVNSKKMSKSSIAVIVLSILLVLSMILGLTGAWFTDKGSDKTSDSIKFGNIDISAELTKKIKLNRKFVNINLKLQDLIKKHSNTTKKALYLAK